ncbi:hypothetical protein LPJ77_002276 [Coemansia sp. RSA 2523]|nr:hypothetical protein LPJ77_002276 [Coemansia sp. RSA 2523]KAJ2528977.1 hypothetical protein IWW43_005142 [Coemansia sp. RSA 1935]KAJ2554000.1 hypothetical protein IWW35_001525 [Coemansia sp. RSA 1878]
MSLYCTAEPTQSNRGTAWLLDIPRTSRSALHSRTSSTSTVVDDICMISTAFPMPSPPMPHTTSISLANPNMPLKPTITAPSSPKHFAKGSMTPQLSPRCDGASKVVEPARNELGEQAGADGCMFDMDSDWTQRSSQSPALDRAALSYGHTGKPQPWAVRRMSQYDSLQAQIRAIDDDDNEFYP